MTGIAHPQPSVRQRLAGSERRARTVALAAVTLLAALLVALIVAVGNDDSPTVRVEPAQTKAGPIGGVRYDGGPEEGSAGAIQQRPAAGTRYDGGPEEGSATLTRRSAPATFDPRSIEAPSGARFDGGPEEGTRGPGN